MRVASAQWTPTPEEMAAFFPPVEPGLAPTGSRVLVQLKQPGRLIGRGFLFKSQEQLDRERINAQVALIRAMGPLAYHNRSTLAPWPEGEWCKPGDIVLVPRFGRDEGWSVRIPDQPDPVEFKLFDDTSMLGHLLRNPEDIWG